LDSLQGRNDVASVQQDWVSREYLPSNLGFEMGRRTDNMTLEQQEQLQFALADARKRVKVRTAIDDTMIEGREESSRPGQGTRIDALHSPGR
ncbi:MAG: hypothetical protein ACPG4T_19480, partial [Nannocystaceae bacterium]